MANQADVYVRNNLRDAIGAIRYNITNGKSEPEPEISIASGNKEKIVLVRTKTYLTIKTPNGVYTADCRFSISNEDLLSWSTMDDHWTVEIKSNNLPQNVPTSVTVDIGEKGP